MKLHELRPNAGANRPRKRVGRGISAGQGKTAGRGTKGQGARQGGGPSTYFQGGNLPFFRRLPFKRGFSPLTRVRYVEVNLDRLTDLPKGSVVTPEFLAEQGLTAHTGRPVAILGRGEIKVALTVRVQKVSGGARTKIEAAGGKVEEWETGKKTKINKEAKKRKETENSRKMESSKKAESGKNVESGQKAESGKKGKPAAS
jgi:large subunit ribosomal protein L15